MSEGGSVDAVKSRGDIDELLRGWGCFQIQWIDEVDTGMVVLRFRWVHDGHPYVGRVRLDLPDDENLVESLRVCALDLERMVGDPREYVVEGATP